MSVNYCYSGSREKFTPVSKDVEAGEPSVQKKINC